MHLVPRLSVLATSVVFGAAATLGASPASAASATYSVSYLTLGNGTKVVARWNPCRAHSYKVNLASVPAATRPTVLAETQAAMRVLAAKSGMTFTYKGSTAEVPRQGSYPTQSADIVIAYTTPAKTNYSLWGNTLGMGGYAGGWRSSTTGTTTVYTAGLIKGYLVLDTPDLLAHLKPGFGLGLRRGNLLLHELAHVVGLGHVSNSHLLMNPTMTSYTPNGYAAGDAAGLAMVGRNAGCIPGW